MRNQSRSVDDAIEPVAGRAPEIGPLAAAAVSLGALSAPSPPGGGVLPPNGEPSTCVPGDWIALDSVLWRTNVPAGSPSGLRFIDRLSLGASAEVKVTRSTTAPCASVRVIVSPLLVM